MLIVLLRRSLSRYRLLIGLVVGLLLVQSVANLYLPNLNADVINNGVSKGDLHYIVVTGAIMLAMRSGFGSRMVSIADMPVPAPSRIRSHAIAMTAMRASRTYRQQRQSSRRADLQTCGRKSGQPVKALPSRTGCV